jgi:hypothetical protein
MTVPTLTEQDLERLFTTLPTLDFRDAERRAVLLEGGSRDIQAAPGSGKTTLLAAKLLLMADRWEYAHRGVCVLSHTNVAREEISRRLGSTASGARLLGYPHFVGTIHAFVNQFLALPMLRSDGDVIDVIDNDVFAARASSLLRTKPTLQAWVARNPHQGPQAIATLRYEGAGLTLGWEEGSLPGPGTPSRVEAQALKDTLRARGVFRFDDMFAFAERLLVHFPDFPKRLSHRFPLVLIDEMQDTSWAQEHLLSRLFDDTVVIQRYGDRNQRILSSEADVNKLTFPKAGHLNITTTKRFPESIAAVVRSVQEHGEPVTASAAGTSQPILMLYDTKVVTSVINAFGKHVLEVFSDDELRRGVVTAICARKAGEAKSAAGRHLIDYWPSYITSTSTPQGEESIYRLLVDPPTLGQTALNLEHLVRDVKRAILLVLRGAKCPAVTDIRDANYLLRKLQSAGVDVAPIRALCRDLAIGRGHTSAANWAGTIDLMFAALNTLLPADFNRESFGSLRAFELPAAEPSADGEPNEHVVIHDGRSVPIRIGTIASVKGETHLATLVLEAYGGRARRYDLEAALESIAGGTPLRPKASESLRGLYRNLYVATSRPSHLLCLAMNRERAPEPLVQKLRDRGWNVLLIQAP